MRPTSATRWRWPRSSPTSASTTPPIAAALLHDAVEDTAITLEDVERDFGPDVAEHRRRRHQARAAPVRAPGGAAGGDHPQDAGRDGQGHPGPRSSSWPTASTTCAPSAAMPEFKQERTAQETLDICGPLATASACRTSSSSSRTSRSPPCTPSATPRSTTWSPARPPERELYLAAGARATCAAGSTSCGIDADVTGAPEAPLVHLREDGREGQASSTTSSTWSASGSSSTSVKDCYAALGCDPRGAGSRCRGRFKDYIAMPKFNLYRVAAHDGGRAVRASRSRCEIRT